MSVSNGQIANATTFNDAFVSKTSLNQDVDGTINLQNTSSGATVTNVQQTINDIKTVNANQDVAITILEDTRVFKATSSTDKAVARFIGTDGQSIDNSLVTISDTGDILTTGNLEVEDIQVNGDAVIEGNVIIQGDATVNGTTTFINTENLDVTDKNITVNKDGTDATSEGSGLTVERDGTNGSLIYGNAYQNKFACGPLGAELAIATMADITAATVTGIQSSVGSADADKFIKTASDGFLDKTFNNTIPSFASDSAFTTFLGRSAVVGDRYFNTVSATTVVYDGTTFVGPTATVSIPTPTVQRFLSGTSTYNIPAGVKFIRVRMSGGGGGGGGSSNANNQNGGNGTAGSATTFGTSLLTANGGGFGSGGSTAAPGSGGAVTINSPAIAVVSYAGGGGQFGGVTAVANVMTNGGDGGNNMFGGAGVGGQNVLIPGGAGIANSGGGGGGASTVQSSASLNLLFSFSSSSFVIFISFLQIK